jgi:hypothetical protein
MTTGPSHDHVLAGMLSRRSVSSFGTEAPTAAEIDAIVRAAVTVPDHGRLRPWRLVIIEGDAREQFAQALADAGRTANAEIGVEALERLRSKAYVAPAMIAVVARVDTTSTVPEIEQIASAACCGYAIALAAHQLGLGAIWKSTNFTTGPSLGKVLDMTDTDRFLGWVNSGRDRVAVDLTRIVRRLDVTGVATEYVPSN